MNDDTQHRAVLRKLWRQHHDEHRRVGQEWRARGYELPAPKFPTYPDELRGMTCGAKTRAGTPCKRTDLFHSGRCKFHGGTSTGPATPEGKALAALNGHRPKRKRTP